MLMHIVALLPPIRFIVYVRTKAVCVHISTDAIIIMKALQQCICLL